MLENAYQKKRRTYHFRQADLSRGDRLQSKQIEQKKPPESGGVVLMEIGFIVLLILRCWKFGNVNHLQGLPEVDWVKIFSITFDLSPAVKFKHANVLGFIIFLAVFDEMIVLKKATALCILV